MVIKEIIRSINGLNEDGGVKCGASFAREVFDMNSELLVDEAKNVSISGAEINMARLPGYKSSYIQVDLTFPSNLDDELALTWDFLTEYGEDITMLDDDSKEIPQIFLTLVPYEFKGKYYLTASLPIFFTLIPLRPHKDYTTIRVLFDEMSVSFFETDSVDYEKIMAVVERETQDELKYLDDLDAKDDENKKLQEERDKIAEDLLRNRGEWLGHDSLDEENKRGDDFTADELVDSYGKGEFVNE